VENPEKNDEFFDKIEVFSSEDDKLKFLGELLSNESSRQILLLLTNQEMSANDLSEKTNLRLSLVIHHLNKMKKIGIVSVDKTIKNTKNHDMKYYAAKPVILILPKDASDRASKSKMLHRSIKKIIRFATIGLAGFISWILSKPLEPKQYSLTEPNSVTDSVYHIDTLLPVVISLAVIITGLVVERIWVYVENKNKT
jgi:vacuolar-type H+-ATPase subunit F/Vma7